MILGFAIILVGFACAQGRPPSHANGIRVGQEAPDFALEDLSGQTVRLSDFKGKQPVMMMFFSTY
ncbi:MAG: redoxin domain-containing protein [Armatimonadetes bacterium]|nr:redoxin domain-containing protein [Armatimonadota bacterium]